MFNLEFLVTRRCNQNCYYCNNSTFYDIRKNNLIDLDIDYMKWVCDIYYDLGIRNIRIELSGGEPGLIKNFEDMIAMLNNLNYVRGIFILSNGLLRQRFQNIKDMIGNKFKGYEEHSALDINGKNILYFNDSITYFNSDSYVIHVLILNDITLDSLLNNFDYFKDIGLFERNIDFKILTPKVGYPSKELFDKTELFYNKLNNLAEISNITLNYSKINKKYIYYETNTKYTDICAKISKFQFIDIENREIGQCSMQVAQSARYPVTPDTIKNAITGKLFVKNSFCENCYKYDKNISKEYFQRLLNNLKRKNNKKWRRMS